MVEFSQILWVQFLFKMSEKKNFYLVHSISATRYFNFDIMSSTTLQVCWSPVILTLVFSSHQRKQSHANPKKPDAHILVLFPFEIKKYLLKRYCWYVFFNLTPHALILVYWIVISIKKIFKSCLDMVLGNHLSGPPETPSDLRHSEFV